MHRLAKTYGRKYPHITQCIATRYQHYNQTIETIQQLEKDGAAFLLRPELPLAVDRFEKDVDKLKLLFEQGYHQADAALPEIGRAHV